MSAGMPELGSKISLISKADIRYEGRLFTVDPQECTIALSNVRSFGTEDREASFPVAPQNQVYDYILFRGSDIKDIRVVQNINPIPNDPAIVTLSVPPPLANSGFQQQQAAQPGAGFSQPGLLGHVGSGVPPFGSSYSSMGGLPSGLAPGMGVQSRLSQESRNLSSELADGLHQAPPPQQQQVPPPIVSPQEQDLIGGRSGAGTPTLRKSPTMDQGTQVGAVGSSRQQQQGQNQGQQRNFRDQRDQRDHRDQHRNDNHGEQRQQYRDNRSRPPMNHQQQNRQGWNNEGPWQQRQMQPHQQQQQQQQQHEGWGPQNNRSGWRGGPRRGRGRGGNFQQRPMGPPGQQQHPQQQQHGQGQAGNAAAAQKKNVLKFEGDYDFEQANTEFENLRSQLANIKLTATAAGQLPTATGEPVPIPTVAVANKVNGEEKKEQVDSGNETGAGEGEAEEDSEIFYDKAKSFFDNISCEAIERSKGCSQRTDWRQERKLNSETFGVASARRGYRGRGGYYRGNMYRGGGGYRGGYRGGRGNYNRNQGQQQHNNQHQQQQHHQQQQGGQRPTAAAVVAGGK